MADRAQHCALKITVWDEPGATPAVYVLRCDPPGGSHPAVEAACALLHSDVDDLFAPLPPDTVSAQVYGGPQQATVTGLWRGRPVNARFSRHNAAEMARWSRAVPLLPDPAAR